MSANAGKALSLFGDSQTWQKRWAWVERRLLGAVDWLNPILVKEARQALKSRQFVITFLIVLVACWIVSFAGVAIIGPQIRYAAAGGAMLIAYYAVLAFPLAVIVPFSAFRSLAVEQEDNTYDLLSITTLSSRQIVAGKLWSAIVQMLVYCCAVSPCLAFTFLLRGVDAAAVLLLLALTILGSIGLSMIALVIGTISRVRHTQVIISVALVLGLALAFSGAIGMAITFQSESHLFLRDAEFWVGLALVLTLYITTFGLLHSAAAAQIAFPSENRSSPLRWWMLAQQACFVGWVSFPLILFRTERNAVAEIVAGAILMATAYWFVMGALMTGEWPHLSRRVQRSLPQSKLGRMFLTWFNPGPGAGYMFAIANLGLLTTVGLILALTLGKPSNLGRVRDVTYLLIFAWCYVTIFLGLGRLIINAVRRFTFVPMAGAFLLQLILVLLGVGIPLLLQMTSNSFGSSRNYALVHVVDPLQTLRILADDGASAVRADVSVLILISAASVVLLLNLRSVVVELRRQRLTTPERLVEEEAMLHPAPAPKPANPWEAEGGAP